MHVTVFSLPSGFLGIEMELTSKITVVLMFRLGLRLCSFRLGRLIFSNSISVQIMHFFCCGRLLILALQPRVCISKDSLVLDAA